MIWYTVKRLGSAVPTLLIVSVIIFMIARLAPGDPITQMLGPSATISEIEAEKARLGLDQPVPVQYVIWLGRALAGDLGTSVVNGANVMQSIIERMPRTFSLALFSVLMSILIGIPLGTIAAIRHNTAWDQAVMGFSFLGLSIPDFVSGLLLIVVFSVQLGWLPSIGYTSISEGGLDGWLAHLVLPSLAIGTSMTAVMARMTRSSVMDVMRREFVVTAHAKGLPKWRVIFQHVLGNAMVPVITIIGINFGAVFRGAVIIETLFSISGIGRLLISGIEGRDYPVIQGCLLVTVVIYVLINLVVDLAYAWIDPRISYR